MARMKKKEPPKGKDEFPDIIRPEPFRGTIPTDRNGQKMSQEDMEQLSWLTEIQKLKAEAKGNPKELMGLEREEREIEQYFRKKEFADSASLAILEERAKLKRVGVFIANDKDDAPFFTNENNLFVRPSALETVDKLLEENDCEPWADGIRYVADFILFRKEVEESDRYAGRTSSSLAHQRVWVESGFSDSTDATVRALLIMGYARRENAPIRLSENSLREDLSMLEPVAAEKIVDTIRMVSNPERLVIVGDNKNDPEQGQEIESMHMKKLPYSWLHVFEILRGGAPDFWCMDMAFERMPDEFYAHSVNGGVMYSESEERNSFSIIDFLGKLPKPSDLVYTIGLAIYGIEQKFFMCDPQHRIIMWESFLSQGIASWKNIANGLLKARNKRDELNEKKEEYNFVVRADGKVFVT